MYQFKLLAFIFSATAFRIKKRSHSWTTRADRANGPCGPVLARGVSAVIGGQDNLPVAMPLICTGEATQVTLSATAYGHTNAVLTLQVDGRVRGSKSFPWWQPGQQKTLVVSLGPLSSGLHSIRFSGEKIDFKDVTLQGSGGSCSFDEAAGWDEAQSTGTYASLDAVNRLFGPSRDFSASAKKQLYFASESVGRSEDGEISSTVVADGFWKWMLSYSQNSSGRDSWGGDWENLWDEAKNHPWGEVSLGQVPGRSGQTMTVIEPCNTLSNIGFHEAAVWASCKAYPFTRDEYASVVSAFNGLAAGSSFLHSCGCGIGNRTDTFTMDWLLLQAYQIMVKETVSGAGDALTEEERNALLSLAPQGTVPAMAVDVARDMTRLLSEKYDRDFWNATVYEYNIPSYLTSIGGVVAFTLYGLKQNSVIPGIIEPLFDELLQVLLQEFFQGEDQQVGEWLQNTYIPAAKKAWGHVTFCRATLFGVDPLVTTFLKFAVTFIESLVYQENVLRPPPIFRTLLGALEALGVNSDLMKNMDRTWDLYNGNDCLSRSDHAIWHIRSGHGLLHLLDMAEILVSRTKHSGSEC